jgi:hypothetical protein
LVSLIIIGGLINVFDYNVIYQIINKG